MALKSVLGPRIPEHYDFFSNLIYKCLYSIQNKDFDPLKDIRLIKILGGSPDQSIIINGIVIERDSENNIKELKNAKIAVYSCPMDSV